MTAGVRHRALRPNTIQDKVPVTGMMTVFIITFIPSVNDTSNTIKINVILVTIAANYLVKKNSKHPRNHAFIGKLI